jgi:hypothetical protein
MSALAPPTRSGTPLALCPPSERRLVTALSVLAVALWFIVLPAQIALGLA